MAAVKHPHAFESGGRTDEPLFIGSGDVLMNLRRNGALKMQVEALQGTNYLLIEPGEVNSKGFPDWKSPWMLMTRL